VLGFIGLKMLLPLLAKVVAAGFHGLGYMAVGDVVRDVDIFRLHCIGVVGGGFVGRGRGVADLAGKRPTEESRINSYPDTTSPRKAVPFRATERARKLRQLFLEMVLKQP